MNPASLTARSLSIRKPPVASLAPRPGLPGCWCTPKPVSSSPSAVTAPTSPLAYANPSKSAIKPTRPRPHPSPPEDQAQIRAELTASEPRHLTLDELFAQPHTTDTNIPF
jgi:hypothetical protein